MPNSNTHAYNLMTKTYVSFEEAVELVGQRWYIKVGHAGFNSRANNGDGYATKDAAMKAVRRYQQR